MSDERQDIGVGARRGGTEARGQAGATGAGGAEDRRARLAAALRANLRRRKAQLRARRGAGTAGGAADRGEGR